MRTSYTFSLWETWRGSREFLTPNVWKTHYIFTFYFTIFDLNISNLLQKLRWTPQSHPKARPGNLWLYQEGWVQSSCCTPYPHFPMVWWQHANYKLRHVPVQGMERWLQAPPGKVPTQNTRPFTRIKVEVTKLLQSFKSWNWTYSYWFEPFIATKNLGSAGSSSVILPTMFWFSWVTLKLLLCPHRVPHRQIPCQCCW